MWSEAVNDDYREISKIIDFLGFLKIFTRTICIVDFLKTILIETHSELSINYVNNFVYCIQ